MPRLSVAIGIVVLELCIAAPVEPTRFALGGYDPCNGHTVRIVFLLETCESVEVESAV